MDFSHNIMHTIQHIIICEQDIMTMMNQMFLLLTIRQLWRSIVGCIDDIHLLKLLAFGNRMDNETEKKSLQNLMETHSAG